MMCSVLSPVDTSIYNNFYNGRLKWNWCHSSDSLLVSNVFPNFIKRACYDGTYDGWTTVGKALKITAIEIARSMSPTKIKEIHRCRCVVWWPMLSGSCWHVEKWLGWLSIQLSSGNPGDRCRSTSAGSRASFRSSIAAHPSSHSHGQLSLTSWAVFSLPYLLLSTLPCRPQKMTSQCLLIYSFVFSYLIFKTTARFIVSKLVVTNEYWLLRWPVSAN